MRITMMKYLKLCLKREMDKTVCGYKKSCEGYVKQVVDVRLNLNLMNFQMDLCTICLGIWMEKFTTVFFQKNLIFLT